MDLTKSTEPKSDQQNFDDYIAGPKTVTITEVKSGTPDQPVEIHLAEFPGRPFKPSKSMRRVLVAAWGAKTAVFAGRQMTLYGDPSVKFGGAAVGGIRISHLSHIADELVVPLTVTRGKRAPFVVQPIPADPDVLRAGLEAATTLDELQQAWVRVTASGQGKNAELVAVKDVMKDHLTEPAPEAVAPS